jgi:proline iminopeptidase
LFFVDTIYQAVLMKKKLKSFIKYGLLLGIIVLIGLVFIPRRYHVPKHEPLTPINFWELATGSTIGYTFIKAPQTETNPPIIYLHGGPGGCITQGIMSTLAPFSKEGYDIYLYDQIGSGHSDRLDNIAAYTVKRHVEDLEEIIKKIGSPKVILIGQSWGAMLATSFLVKHPQLIEKIILTGPGPILPMKHNIVVQKAPDSLHFIPPIFSNQDGNKKANNMRMKFIRWWASIFEEKWADDSEVDDFFTHLNTALNRSTVCDTSYLTEVKGGGGYYAQIMTLKSFQEVIDFRTKMKTIQTPMLIMKGQCDNQKWAFTKEYLDIFPNARLHVIPNAGHSITTEQQELYTHTILDFLNS